MDGGNELVSSNPLVTDTYVRCSKRDGLAHTLLGSRLGRGCRSRSNRTKSLSNASKVGMCVCGWGWGIAFPRLSVERIWTKTRSQVERAELVKQKKP